MRSTTPWVAVSSRNNSNLLTVISGPTLAALIVTGVTEGRAGVKQFLKRFIQWRVGLPWYLVALFIMLIIWRLGYTAVVGLPLLKCLHLNDSRAPRGSRRDRHQWIGEGTIGPEAFRRIMRDVRLREVIKIIETPKGDDPVRHDRRMLRRLRAYARVSGPQALAVRMT